MRNLIVFGTSEAAELAHYHLVASGIYNVAAFCVDGAYLREASFRGRPVIAIEDAPTTFPPAQHDAFVAIGYSKLNRIRAKKCAAMQAAGYALASCISRQAIVAPDAALGANCFVMEGCIIQTGARIGNHVTMWSGGHVAHHSTLGDNVFLAPRVAIAGRVHVGDYCFIGINATLRDHIRIGSNCVIGAGAVALHDLPDGMVLDGVTGAMRGIDPARISE